MNVKKNCFEYAVVAVSGIEFGVLCCECTVLYNLAYSFLELDE